MGSSNAGRKPIPWPVKVAKGTARNERKKDNPDPSPDLPLPPAWINKRAKQIFHHLVNNRLSHLNLASRSYTEKIALLACRMEEVERLDKILQKGGYTYTYQVAAYRKPSKDSPEPPLLDRTAQRPEVKWREKAMHHVDTLLASFGLDPSSAQKVGSTKSQKKKSEFDGI